MRATGLQVLGSGASFGTLSYFEPAEAALPEGSQVQLTLSMGSRWPGFAASASALSAAMAQAGARPWTSAPLATADPAQPTWYVRWIKGQTFLPRLIALIGRILAAGWALVARIVGWVMYKVTAAVLSAVPVWWWVVGVIGVGGAVAAGAAARRRGVSSWAE